MKQQENRIMQSDTHEYREEEGKRTFRHDYLLFLPVHTGTREEHT
jgi:hypothetical protein